MNTITILAMLVISGAMLSITEFSVASSVVAQMTGDNATMSENMTGGNVTGDKLRANFTADEQQQLMDGISFKIDDVTFSHHTASVNGIQLHYVIGGQGDPVVLLHGWPETWYAWHKVMPALAKNYTVIAPDLRGMGDSSKPLTGYDGKTVAEDIHRLVTQLGFKSIFLVGHDIGSATSVTRPHSKARAASNVSPVSTARDPARLVIWWKTVNEITAAARPSRTSVSANVAAGAATAMSAAATIPILLDEMFRDGKLKKGPLLCFLALGAGIHYGASLLRL